MKRSVSRVLNTAVGRFIMDVVKVYFNQRVSRAAAELAYFLVLTFFPIIICVSAFVDKLNLNLVSLLDDASRFLPAGVVIIFKEYLSYLDGNYSTGMFLAGLVLAVLFASAAVRGLMNFMHELYGRATFRGVSQLGASILFSVLLLATIYLSMAVVVSGNWFFHQLGVLLGLEDLVGRFGTWQWMKYLLLLAMVFLFILLLYRFAAPLDKPRPPVVPGAMGAAVALAIASMIFSQIMGRSTRYSLVYGSLTAVIILLVWLYLCGTILILGNVANYVIYCRRKKKRQAG